MVPAAQAEPSYGAVDIGAMGQDSQSVFSSTGKKIYLNFPATPSTIGDSVSLPVRLLPPWTSGRSFAHVKYAEHRLDAVLVPDAGKRQFVYATCYDSEGGPGRCPICEAQKLDTTGDLAKYRPKGKYMWQALALDNIKQHFRQRFDEATQQPMLQANGDPVWDVVPAVIRMSPTLHRAVTKFFEKKGDATHPVTGYGMELIKTKTGAGSMEIEYSAMDTAPSQIDATLMPVLANLIDLQAQVHFYSLPEMQLIAQNMLATVAAPAEAPAAYQPPPQAPLAPVATPPAAPAMPPAAPQAAPAAPVVPQAPQTAAPPLPPATAPGGIPAAPPVGSPNVPPTAAPAPGLPAGMQPPPAAPPGEPGRTPEEFEQGLLGENQGATPF
jgi:hypothetical protein